MNEIETELAAVCQNIAEDGSLTEHEVHYLAEWLAASPAARRTHIGSKLAEVVNEILADGVIDEAELHRLAPLLGEAIASHYSPSLEQTSKPPPIPEPERGLVAGVKTWLAARREKRHLEEQEKRRKEQERILVRQRYVEVVVRSLQSGEGYLKNSGSFIEQPGERICWIEAGVLQEIKVVRRRYVGSHAGTRIRVAKGLSFSVGGSRGQSVSEEGLVPVAKGHLILTTRRLVFSGDMKSIAVKLDKLIDIQVANYGIQFSESGKKPKLIRFDVLNGDIVVAIMNFVMNGPSAGR